MAMNEDEAVRMMERHGIRPTANRIIITRTLAASTGPMSLMELEHKMLTIDKSIISRTLTAFKETHMVHVIESGEASRYELCRSHNEDGDDDRHVHFYCESCHRTTCLENIPVPNIELPAGFLPYVAEYTVRGICPECRK